MEGDVLFDSWDRLGRVLLACVLAYPALVLFLRLSGKRTLTKLNAFDLVVTVALGSTLSATVVNDSTPLTDGLVALAALIGLQFVVAWGSVRSSAVEQVMKSEPTLLVLRGEVRDDALRAQRVSRSEVLAAIRSNGLASFDATGAVILETDGSMSVIPREALVGDGIPGVRA
jgi:uncharacterized membrane protein YcaP (DUF421 family)